MFFRLTSVDGLPLPCRTTIGEHEYEVIGGGLLLESRRLGAAELGSDGYSALKFFGRPSPQGDGGLIAASGEPYRLDSDGRLDISRRNSAQGARFRGAIEGDVLRISADGGSIFLRPATELTFVAAPHDPIAELWANTFNFGPPVVEPVEPWRKNDPAVRAEIARAVAAGEPERLRAARERLEKAWRAPA